MSEFTSLELRPLHRPGSRQGFAYTTESWSWDFVVDGRSLLELLRGGDVIGVLGAWDRAQQVVRAERLLGKAAPDLPPDRVALYVCPECGDLGCGAITASVLREGDGVVWRDFAWERDWSDPAVDDRRVIPAGPFIFERAPYGRLLRAALDQKPGPEVSTLSAV